VKKFTLILILCFLFPLVGYNQSSDDFNFPDEYTLLDTASNNVDSIDKIPELLILLNPCGDSCSTVNQFKNITSISTEFQLGKINENGVLKFYRLVIERNGKEIFNKDFEVDSEQYVKDEYDGITKSYLLPKKVLKAFSSLEENDVVKFAAITIELKDSSRWTFEKIKPYRIRAVKL
jgi:hypothetical protein